MIVAVDFDGTIVEHAFPKIGKPLPLAFETLRAMQQFGFRLILWTCREDHPRLIDKRYLHDAIEFCRQNGVEFIGINETPMELEFREQGLRRKVYADIYIDDRNIGGFPGWRSVAESLCVEDFIEDEAAK